jgi:hypothetical protein
LDFILGFPYGLPFNYNFDFDGLVCPQAPLSFAYLFKKILFEDTEYFSATSVVPYVLLFFKKFSTIPNKRFGGKSYWGFDRSAREIFWCQLEAKAKGGAIQQGRIFPLVSGENHRL